VYTNWSGIEFMFHVTTLLPYYPLDTQHVRIHYLTLFPCVLLFAFLATLVQLATQNTVSAVTGWSLWYFLRSYFICFLLLFLSMPN
jgi:hypothetical protein